METIRFKNDTATRKRLFVPESFAHPAKGQTGMWQTMIERYSKPGDLVLDPMAGSGVTLLAALMGRNVVCVELEQHFVEPMRRSWEKMRQMPMLGYTMGDVVIVRGDARALPMEPAHQTRRASLGGYTRPPQVTCIVTSPPFQDQEPFQDKSFNLHGTGPVSITRPSAAGYTRPPVADVVITSPPYEGSEVAQSSDGEANRRFRAGEYQGDALKGMGLSKGYTHPVDAIVTSPPFQDTAQSTDTEFLDKLEVRRNGSRFQGGNRDAYGQATENIGNLRSDAYWSAMRQVYSECWRVLRPGGLLALVVKGFTRDGKYVDLPGQTEAMLLEAGWLKHDHWKRELWSLSFWRNLQKRRDPAAFDNRLMYEEVLAFRKPEGTGQGVATIITSPPYEGSVGDNKEGPNQTSVPGGVNKHGGYTKPVSP